jgi:RHS repeat-associated protein
MRILSAALRGLRPLVSLRGLRPLVSLRGLRGNLRPQGTNVYTWDAANRLVSANVDGVVSSFEYDGSGNRTAQTAGGVTTEYVLDVAGGLPEVIVATTAGTSTYYVQIQGQVLAQQESGAWVYILPDHLGSVRQVVGSDSQVDLAQSFDPFGVLFETFGSGASEFGYTGEWWDVEAGLLYLRARDYDPVVGRFLAKDPWLGDPFRPLSLNGWGYVEGNPINRVDPTGYQTRCDEHGYCPEIDRYLCGPNTPGGYDYRGLPCIVNPKNVQINAHSDSYTPGFSHMNWDSPASLGDRSWNWLVTLYDPARDPLTPYQWQLSKQEARLFEIPVELVAGTIAVEIVHDTDWYDYYLDVYLQMLPLILHYCPPAGFGNVWLQDASDMFLEGYEHYWGLARGRGPGNGVANVHVLTAKRTENYFARNYPGDPRLPPARDIHFRMAVLETDAGSIHYAAAILRMLSDMRTGVMGPHYSLSDTDMEVIYSAYRSDLEACYGSEVGYRDAFASPKDCFGQQILEYLVLYHAKLQQEE